MFKKWKKKEDQTLNPTSVSVPTPPPSQERVQLIAQTFTAEKIIELEKVTCPDTAWPWGQGEDKVFGMENFGFSCYIASILQTLYHLQSFRLTLLGNPDKTKKCDRRITTKGKEPHGFSLAMKSDRVEGKSNGNMLKPPIVKNSQGNISLVGIGNSQTNSEQRKRIALIQGPLLNIDESLSANYGMEEGVYSALKDTFEAIVENGDRFGVVSPWLFVEVIKRENEMFREAMHQDAHEFLNFLLNSLIETKGIPQGLFNSIFEGELTSETKCLKCEKTSYRDEKFLDLSVDIEQHSSITNCLKLFSQMEKLDENNKFHCERCESLQLAEKCVKLNKLPKVLSFHLKRFKYSEQLGRMVKLFHRVEYTNTLRIFNTSEQSQDQNKLYELYSVVVHIGGGPYHGHYISLVKTEQYGWLLFDDEAVDQVDENFVFKFFGDGAGIATAYLVFYREVNEEQFSGNSLYSGFNEDGVEEHEEEENEDKEVDTTLELDPFNTGTLDTSLDNIAIEKPGNIEIRRRSSVFKFGFKKK